MTIFCIVHELKSKKIPLILQAAKTLILYGNWFTNSFVYYGLTLNTGDLGGSFMLTFVLYGVLEIPAYAFALFVILKAGRKLPYVTLMALTGVALLAILAVPEDRFTGNWPVVILAMLGKFFITGKDCDAATQSTTLSSLLSSTATFAIIYVFSAETYPTVVRSVGIGSSSVFARIGGMVAPYVGSLGNAKDHEPRWMRIDSKFLRCGHRPHIPHRHLRRDSPVCSRSGPLAARDQD